ncbi:MAG: GTP-binding protein [Hyphomicrobiaceae bacterium]
MEIRRPLRVAIIGRPNVGKSTLFNRLIRRRRAITLDIPGVTRDPIVEPVLWDDQAVLLIDTGGLRGESEISLADKVHEHTVRAVGEADLAVVIFDAKSGLSPLDRETVDLVVRSGVPTLYVANKAEVPRDEDRLVEFCELGIDLPMPISAEHNIGITELREAILDLGKSIERGPILDDDQGDDKALRHHACKVALVGRPNVGKSSFLNRVAGEELSLVDDVPGTTRDVIDTSILREGQRYVLLDTAGLRRPSRVESGIEKLSVRRTLEAVDRADVVVLMIEPIEGMTDQDARIARRAWTEGRALIVAVNKMDLHGIASAARLEQQIEERYPTLGGLEVVFLSVHQGTGVEQVFEAVDRARAAHNLSIATADVNRVLAWAAERRAPPVISRGRVRFLYGTQTSVRPPTITIFANRDAVPADYVKFLERCFRESLPLAGTPLRLRFRRRASHGDNRE